MRAGHLRSRGRIYREIETRDEYRNTIKTWVVVGTTWMEVRPPKRLLTSFGAGEISTGTMEVELRPMDLKANDVIKIYAGPESGTQWRVINPHDTGKGQMLALLEIYNGDLND